MTAVRIVKMDSDAQLLHQYATQSSESALAEVVRRYVDLVYSAALRRLNGNRSGAADVTQSVFVSVAKNARSLADHPALGAWLHTATRNAALNFMKAEQRRHQVEAAAASDPALDPETAHDWYSLQTVIDAALDELSEEDRAAIVLRFFQQASFRDVATATGVSEDAARMRTDRALQKLRKRLAARGVTSTASALGLALGQHGVFAAPATVTASVIAQACATVPLSSTALGILFMTKMTAPFVSSVVAASLTAGAWVYLAPGVSAGDLQHLRAENARLALATGPSATDATIDAVAREYVDRAANVAQRVQARFYAKTQSASSLTNSSATSSSSTRATDPATSADAADPSRHRNHGIATPRDAYLTFGWAGDSADVDALAKMIWLDPDIRKLALETMANQPRELVAQYPTPEKFYAFITAAASLEGPPPSADILERKFDNMQPTEVQPGRLKFPNNYEFQKTDQGWKWVLPKFAIKGWLHVLSDPVLTTPSPQAKS